MTMAMNQDAVMDAPVAARGRVWWLVGWAAFLLLFAGYAVLLFSRFAPAITQPDDNGYFAQASLIVRDHTTWFKMASPAQYVGMHWLLTPDGKLVPRYPAGLAVIIGAIYATFGWRAAVMTNPLLALGCLFAVFLVTRRVTGRAIWGITAAAVLGINPTFVEHALSGDAHIGVACFLAWAMYLLVVWNDTRKGWVALLAGIAFGVIPTIRYPDCVMYLGLGAFVLWSLFGAWRYWEHVLVMAAGSMVPILPILIRNQLVLGHFWKTGYELTNEQTGFSKDYFLQHYSLYLENLLTNGMGVFYGLGILGIVGMIGSRKYRGLGLMTALAVIPMVLLYMAYYWAGMGQNGAGIMRFMVPVFVPLTIAGAWVVAEVGNKLALPARVALPVVLLAFQGYWGIPEFSARLDQQKLQRENLAVVTGAMEQAIEPGAVVVSDNGLLQHLDYVRIWKLADQSNYRGGMGFGRFGGRADDQPSPMQPAKQKMIANLYSGSLDERKAAFYKDCTTWADGKKVYFVGTEIDARSLGKVGPAGEMRIVKRIQLPKPEVNDNGAGGPGGGFGGPPGGGPGGPGGGPGGGMGGGRGQGRNFGGGGGGGGGQRRGFGGGPGGGIMGAGNFGGATEVVIAQWVPAAPVPQPAGANVIAK